MNLRHIDEFLEKHSAGWKPFRGDFRISKSSLRHNPLDDLVGRGSLIGKAYRGFSDFGTYGGAKLGYESPEYKHKMSAKASEAEATAEAAAKQAEFEASKRAGLERLALKRKKGFGASMIVNPSLGSTSTLGS
jgi:hypothetical protein